MASMEALVTEFILAELRAFGRVSIKQAQIVVKGKTKTDVPYHVAWSGADKARKERNKELIAMGSKKYIVRPQGKNDWLIFESDNPEEITPGEFRYLSTYRTMVRQQAVDLRQFDTFYAKKRSAANRNLHDAIDTAVKETNKFGELFATVAGI